MKIYVALIGAAFAFIGGLVLGDKRGRFDAALEENKIAAGCLRSDDLTISPEFREYLKGRIYWNISTKYPNDGGYLLREDWDFGPVNLEVLKQPTYAKGPIGNSESFTLATAHLSNADRGSSAKDAPADEHGM